MRKIAAVLVCLLAACVVKKENPVDTVAASSTTKVTNYRAGVLPAVEYVERCG
jgi:hypothetical protein